MEADAAEKESKHQKHRVYVLDESSAEVAKICKHEPYAHENSRNFKENEGTTGRNGKVLLPKGDPIVDYGHDVVDQSLCVERFYETNARYEIHSVHKEVAGSEKAKP